jgi:hypothetical protein
LLAFNDASMFDLIKEALVLARLDALERRPPKTA